MKLNWKRGLAFVCALVLVVAAGFYSSDHFLKATDGEENIVDSTEAAIAETLELSTEALAEADEVVAIEQGVYESDMPDGQDTEAEPLPGEEESAGEEADDETAAGEEIAEAAAAGEETAESVNAEEEAVEEEAAEEEAAEEEPERSVVIAYEVVGGKYTGVGSQILLTAVPTGYEDPSYQWQYYDGSSWKNIDGATSSAYTLNVTKENTSYRWRVDVEENEYEE
jgi:hypothetical protein